MPDQGVLSVLYAPIQDVRALIYLPSTEADLVLMKRADTLPWVFGLQIIILALCLWILNVPFPGLRALFWGTNVISPNPWFSVRSATIFFLASVGWYQWAWRALKEPDSRDTGIESVLFVDVMAFLGFCEDFKYYLAVLKRLMSCEE